MKKDNNPESLLKREHSSLSIALAAFFFLWGSTMQWIFFIDSFALLLIVSFFILGINKGIKEIVSVLALLVSLFISLKTYRFLHQTTSFDFFLDISWGKLGWFLTLFSLGWGTFHYFLCSTENTQSPLNALLGGILGGMKGCILGYILVIIAMGSPIKEKIPQSQSSSWYCKYSQSLENQYHFLEDFIQYAK